MAGHRPGTALVAGGLRDRAPRHPRRIASGPDLLGPQPRRRAARPASGFASGRPGTDRQGGGRRAANATAGARAFPKHRPERRAPAAPAARFQTAGQQRAGRRGHRGRADPDTGLHPSLCRGRECAAGDPARSVPAGTGVRRDRHPAGRRSRSSGRACVTSSTATSPGAGSWSRPSAAFYAKAPGRAPDEAADFSHFSPKPRRGNIEVWLPAPAAGGSHST